MDEVSYEEYRHDSTDVTDEDLTGFFEGWPSKPSPSVFLAVLAGSHYSFIARTGDGRVIGVVSAISDGVLSASIPLLEVVPEFRGRGIGTRLVRLVLERLEGFYMVDLTCDEGLVPFYRRFGMQETRAMSIRRPHAISGDRP
jgi:ribosomal protein S18 acetylase RimI-like enzyme